MVAPYEGYCEAIWEDIETNILVCTFGKDRYTIFNLTLDYDMSDDLVEDYPDLVSYESKIRFFTFESIIKIMIDLSTTNNFSLDTMLWLNKQRRLLR